MGNKNIYNVVKMALMSVKRNLINCEMEPILKRKISSVRVRILLPPFIENIVNITNLRVNNTVL